MGDVSRIDRQPFCCTTLLPIANPLLCHLIVKKAIAPAAIALLICTPALTGQIALNF